MDWNLKAPAWDLTELEQAAISNIHAAQGSSSSLRENMIRGEFSIDLKLNFNEKVGDKGKEAQLGSKRARRASGNGAQMASCLVDGCISDLSNCREYHRRHKVCEQHSKTPQVTIRGHKQRFCQQCSRFHSLEEFDEGKRSCRKRLDGHNRRRRKPQPEPISRSLTGRGSLLSNYQGSQMLSFSNTQVYPSTTVMSGAMGNDEDARLYNQHQRFNLLDKQTSSSLSRYKGGDKHFTALQGHGLSLNHQSSKASICQPLLMSIALPDSGHNIFCDPVPFEDCALSLLSSPQLQTSGLNFVQPDSTPMGSVVVSSGRDAEIHYPHNYHLGSDESSRNNTSQTPPFH